jgi:YHS domain-containing protein
MGTSLFDLRQRRVQLPNRSPEHSGRNTLMNPERQVVIDPVCKMPLRADQIRQSVVRGDQQYFFCSIACRAEFERHPEDYSKQARQTGEFSNV